METSAFVRAVARDVSDTLPTTLGAAHVEVRGWMVKWWFGNKDLHYECQPRTKLGVVEIGLHFEADGLTNARLLGAFRTHERALRGKLGGVVRLEEWDKGWARLWEPFEAKALDAALQQRLGKRIVAYVRTLEPILRDELPDEVAWRLTGTTR